VLCWVGIMKGVRKLIYVPSDEVWLMVKQHAAAENRSISNYLINLHMANMECKELGFSPGKLPGKVKVSDSLPVKKAAEEIKKVVANRSEDQSFFNPMPKQGKKVKK